MASQAQTVPQVVRAVDRRAGFSERIGDVEGYEGLVFNYEDRAAPAMTLPRSTPALTCCVISLGLLGRRVFN